MNDEELLLRLRTPSLMGGSSRAAIRTTWSMGAARAATVVAACYARDGRTDIDVCGGIYFSSFHLWHCADSVI
jgi:hypothetical protein